LPIAHGGVETWSITVMHLASIFVITIWILSEIKNGGIRFYKTPLDLPLAAFSFFILISFFISRCPDISRIELYKIANYILIFYYLSNILHERSRIRPLAWFIVIFGAIYAISGLIIVKGRFLGFKVFSSINDYITLTFVNHNHFAGYLEVIAPLGIGLAISERGLKRVFLLVLSVCMTVAIFLSLSRGGIIGLSVGIIFFMMVSIYKWRARVFLMLSAFIVITLIVLVSLGGLDHILDRMSAMKTPELSGKSRLIIWRDSINILKDHLWFGTGIGTFRYSYPRYQSTPHDFFIDHAHNAYIELATEMGITGALSALFIILTLFISVLKNIYREYNLKFHYIAIGSLTGCLSLLVHNFTDFNFYISSNAFIFSIVASIAISSSSSEKGPLLTVNLMGKKKIAYYIGVISLAFVFITLSITPFLGDLYYTTAKEHEKLKQYDSAYYNLQKAIRYEPLNADYHSALGDLMLEMAPVLSSNDKKISSYLESLGYYNEAITRCPDRGYFYLKKAYVLQLIGRREEAEAALKTAVLLSPQTSANYYSLANLYISSGRPELALREYKEYLRIEPQETREILQELWDILPDYDTIKKVVPDIIEARREFADFLFEKGLSHAAKEELSIISSQEMPLKTDASDAGEAVKHIDELIKRGMYSSALSVCKGYLERFRDDVYIKDRLAQIYEKMGDPTAAISIYTEIIEKNKIRRDGYSVMDRLYDDEAEPLWLYRRLADLYEKTKHYEEAIALLEKVLKKWPDNKDIRYSLLMKKGAYLTREGKIKDALLIYNQLLNEGYNEAWVYIQLAHLYKKAGRYQDVINILEEANRQWPQRKDVHQFLLIEKGEYLARHGDYNDAIPIYNQLLNEGFQPLWLYVQMGNLYDKTRQYQEGIRILNEGLQVWQRQEQLYYLLAVLYFKAGDHDKAWAHARRCLEIKPDYNPCQMVLDGLKRDNGRHKTTGQ